jgi:glycosyltransferase involved in cell wall biosynthesis
LVNPLVTVLLPVYNCERYVRRAVKSILHQSYSNMEIIATDDGSTDRSRDVLRQCAKEDSRIRVIERENRGLIATLNEGLGLARTDLIARMDSDDIAYPSRIAKQVAAFQNNPRLALSGCYYDLIFSSDRVAPIRNVPFSDPEDLRILSLFFCVQKHPTVMFRKSSIPADVLHYDADYPHAEDFDLFGRIAAVADTAIIPEPLLAYREHAGSVSNRHADLQARTHLRIVARNLLAEGVPVDVSALHGSLPPDPVQAGLMGRLIKDLEHEALNRHNGKEAFRFGVANLFIFIFAMLRQRGSPTALATYLDVTGGWEKIRRFDRIAAKAGRSNESMAWMSFWLVDAMLAMQSRGNSTPARKAVSGWQQLL